MCYVSLFELSFFFFNDTATTEIYTLSLHDALPISWAARGCSGTRWSSYRAPTWRSSSSGRGRCRWSKPCGCWTGDRSEEHTSELQSQSNLVCRLLLEKKKVADAAPSNHTG